MKRVLVIGSGGAGKTTFAREVAARTGLPLVHLDALYWRPGWIATAPQEWTRIVAKTVRGDAWVMDGNYGGTLPLRLAACDTVVFLDTPRMECLWRVVRRRLSRRRTDPSPGCRERLTWEFIVWIWTYPRKRRPEILAQLRSLVPSKRVVVLRVPLDAARFLGEIDPRPSERGDRRIASQGASSFMKLP